MKKTWVKLRMPPSLFAILFGILLLMSGVHQGLVVLMNTWNGPVLLQVLIPLAYWAAVAAGLTIYTAWRICETYDKPMMTLADAANKVAHGDFSVYVTPYHAPDKYDYLDRMIVDFNKMVEELGSMETLKTDFAANVSHELKTPLAAIHNYAQLLQNTPLDDRQAEDVRIILENTNRLSSLIFNILKLNKLESQKILPTASGYDLCAQLAECMIGFEPVWEKKDMEPEVELEDRTMVWADAELMAVVWNNLLSNAFKFTPPGGTVTLRQSSTPEEVTVQVADTGCGMDETTMRRIFDKFYQGDTSHSTEGNGLGLALVMRILQLSGGTIAVDSTPGKGSVFTVRLPRQRGEQQ